MTSDLDGKTAFQKAIPALMIAATTSVAGWGWSFVQNDIEVRAEAAELRAENKALARQANICQEITESATRLIAAARQDK